MQLLVNTEQRTKKKRTARRQPRRELDRYLTPRFACEALIDAYPEIGGAVCCEPCSGGGVLEQVLRARFRTVITNDIDTMIAADTHFDARRADCYADWRDRDCRLSWIITNPPFCAWSEIAKTALDQGLQLALLLRISALEATKQRRWLAQRSPSALLILPRIRVTAARGTDSCCNVWAIWSPEVPPGIRYAETNVRQQSLFLGVAA